MNIYVGFKGWLFLYYRKHTLAVWILKCPTEEHFISLVTEKQIEQEKIDLQQTVIKTIIANDAEGAYRYASEVLKGPFSEGESAIAKDAMYAYYYSFFTLNKPFPIGEAAIATEPQWACYYADDVLKGRFVLGEECIKKNPIWRYYYQEKFDVIL